MEITELAVVSLEDGGDGRGSSFSPPHRWLKYLRALEDVHIATIRPGQVRGNHYHVARRELLVVIYSERWSLHWDKGEGTELSRRSFDGAGAVLVAVPASWSHAIRNDSLSDLWLVGASDVAYDPDNPDAFRRVVVSDESVQGYLPDILPHQ
jgi:oxalate decarboxylase/phosphoglucose isomerase-like protein (cupin superfamily)